MIMQIVKQYIKFACSLHTPFLELVRLIKYGVSNMIVLWHLWAILGIFSHGIFMDYLKCAGCNFGMMKTPRQFRVFFCCTIWQCLLGSL